MQPDIRDQNFIDHRDLVGLNFIRADTRFLFRRHFRQGLRSHIMEVLAPEDVEAERRGRLIDGVVQFPRAQPRMMLRIFRTRFSSLQEVLQETRRVKVTERYLTADYVARSTEIIVDYRGPENPGPLLCGLQEYVAGVALDPWSGIRGTLPLTHYYEHLKGLGFAALASRSRWLQSVAEHGSSFVARVRKMIIDGGYIPDLAGMGNVFLTPEGTLKLVDINNVSEVVFDSRIRLDDRGYPVCDKSIEALALIEGKLLGRRLAATDAIYGFFLDPARRDKVERVEKEAVAGLRLP